jgi:hypothetical protein
MDRPIITPLILVRWNLACEDRALGTVRHAFKVTICPHTRSDDFLVIMRPILRLLAAASGSNGVVSRPIQHVDEMFYAAAVSRPSHHPQFIVITVFEESIRDHLISELADEELFGIRLDPKILYPQDSVLRIPDNIFASEPDNSDEVIQNLRHRITAPADQLVLAELLCSHIMDDYTVLAALSEYYRDT